MLPVDRRLALEQLYPDAVRIFNIGPPALLGLDITSYGVTGLPLTVVIAANGLVDFVAAGGVTEDTLEMHVRNAMNP